MSEAQRYRKKPVVIEAMQLANDNIEQVADWVMGGIVASGDHETDVSATLAGPDRHLDINTLEGVMRADVGDWIIRGVPTKLWCRERHRPSASSRITD